MAVSSAYIAKWTPTALGMSLMYRLKSSGPNKDPCGTPLRIGRGVERLFSTLALNSREFRVVVYLKKASARVIADNFFDNNISRFGAPIKLISDNGPLFISDIFENLSERLGIRHVKTVVYRPQANRTERVNRDLVQMIANYVNEHHHTWDQFLCRKLITPFQKLVIVSDGTEFAVGDIERLFEEARRNTKAKHEKWEKYYNRRRHDVQIKVRIYRHRKCDETYIGTGSSDNGSLRDESSGFDRVQRRSKESQDGKKNGSEVKRELEVKGISFKNDQGEKHTNKTNKRRPLISDQYLVLGLRKVEGLKEAKMKC
ncbi:uncharacterized protein TNCV_3260611 [Trichonephila clavipes]|nr:uncharacterized protein TNCV_3260611 [Trichonephila clavipes]